MGNEKKMNGNSAIPSILILMLILIILFGRRHEHSNVIFGPGHITSAIKSTSHKFSQEDLFERYDPVEIEHKSLQIMHLNVTYRRGRNNDTNFYIEKGERIPVLFLHGPD